MGMWIGRNRKARVTYGFDEIALVPGRVTINPNEVDITCRWPRKEADPLVLKIPILASAMDGVVDVRFAIAMNKLGGLAVLNLEGVQTCYKNLPGGPAKIIEADKSEITALLQKFIQEPIQKRFNCGTDSPDQRRRRAGLGRLHSTARSRIRQVAEEARADVLLSKARFFHRPA